MKEETVILQLFYYFSLASIFIYIIWNIFNDKIQSCVFWPLASTSEINTECSSSSAKLFHCAICGQSAPSTEQRPIGYVVFIQPGTGELLKLPSEKYFQGFAATERCSLCFF